MKTAIYIEDGTVQLVLTPETEFEKSTMSHLIEKKLDAEMFEGEFYDCRGGWVRQKAFYQNHFGGLDTKRDQSLIIRVSKKTEKSMVDDPDFRFAVMDK